MKSLAQGWTTLVLESRCPACFTCFPAPAHMIQMKGCYQALWKPGNDHSFDIQWFMISDLYKPCTWFQISTNHVHDSRSIQIMYMIPEQFQTNTLTWEDLLAESCCPLSGHCSGVFSICCGFHFLYCSPLSNTTLMLQLFICPPRTCTHTRAHTHTHTHSSVHHAHRKTTRYAWDVSWLVTYS